MAFSRLFGAARTALQIPLVRHIATGVGVTWAYQEVMSIAGSVWIESEKIKSESTDEEEPKFKHYRLIAEQAFRDSGFKNPIYIRFEGINEFSIAAAMKLYHPNDKGKSAFLFLDKEKFENFTDKEIYAVAGHEAQHVQHEHALIRYFALGAGASATYQFIQQHTQSWLPAIIKMLRANSLASSFAAKTLPVVAGFIGIYGIKKIIYPQIEKVLELEADISSARILGTKEQVVSFLDRSRPDPNDVTNIHSVVNAITKSHPSADMRIKLLNLMKTPTKESTPMYRFFHSEKYLSSKANMKLVEIENESEMKSELTARI